MARRRMLDPNFWESEDVSRCALFTRLVFLGLVSIADDEGRGRAKPVYLRSTLFPYDEWVRVADIETALSEMALNLSVTFYEADGAEYYQLDHWRRWQKVDKPKASQLPAPKGRECVGDASANDQRSVGDESRLKEKKGKEKEVNRKERKGNALLNMGEFRNVALSAEEVETLKEKFTDWNQRIEALSAYMASTGKTYADHYAAICSWSIREMPKKSAKQKICSGVDPLALKAIQKRFAELEVASAENA